MIRHRTGWEVSLDRIVTSRLFGFPIMFILLATVFWLTIEGANVPSAMIASFLVDTIQPFLKNYISLNWCSIIYMMDYLLMELI